MNSLRIQIPSLPENIRVVESFIDNVKDKYNFDDDIYGNIMIAVTESVNNAIKHGNQMNPKKNVSLACEYFENKVVFQVEDEGQGFDINNLPDPTSPEKLEEVGGRGIFLMRHLADEVEFKNEGKIVELTFYFN
jgi:serine/threonine-protein kinase RsbW